MKSSTAIVFSRMDDKKTTWKLMECDHGKRYSVVKGSPFSDGVDGMTYTQQKKMEKNLIHHNLYGKRIAGQWQEIIMPDQYGEMKTATPKTSNWFAIKWPTNPHFTGEQMILHILNSAVEK